MEHEHAIATLEDRVDELAKLIYGHEHHIEQIKMRGPWTDKDELKTYLGELLYYRDRLTSIDNTITFLKRAQSGT